MAIARAGGAAIVRCLFLALSFRCLRELSLFWGRNPECHEALSVLCKQYEGTKGTKGTSSPMQPYNLVPVQELATSRRLFTPTLLRPHVRAGVSHVQVPLHRRDGAGAGPARACGRVLLSQLCHTAPPQKKLALFHSCHFPGRGHCSFIPPLSSSRLPRPP